MQTIATCAGKTMEGNSECEKSWTSLYAAGGDGHWKGSGG